MTAVRYTDELVHGLSHVNVERRAGRTWCGRYIEFWPDELLDVPVTCLTCMTEPKLSDGESLAAREDVEDRRDDVVHRCRDHLYHQDENGRCSRCGYGRLETTHR